MDLLVTGGWFDDSGECWIERVALGRRERVLTFLPPEAHRIARKGFTGAALHDGHLLVCSFDAVWRFDTASWRCTGRLHQPDFNDLHGVTVDLDHDTVLVANTGLDSVEIIGFDGAFRGRIGLTPGWVEARRQTREAIERDQFPVALAAGWSDGAEARWEVHEDAYYEADGAASFHQRKVRDYFHPNHVILAGDGRVLVTLLATREVRCLRTFRPFATFDGHPHDGVPVDDGWWLTTTDGKIWALRSDGSVSMILDTATSGHIGWCRGLAVAADWFAVGLTAIVSKPQYRWRDDPPDATETSVLWFRRSDGELIGRVDLTDRVRGAKIFALVPWVSL